MQNYLRNKVYTMNDGVNTTNYKVIEVKFIDSFRKMQNFINKGGVPSQWQLIDYKGQEIENGGGLTDLMLDLHKHYGANDLICTHYKAGIWYTIAGISMGFGNENVPVLCEYTCMMPFNKNFEPKIMVRLEKVK